MNYFKVRIADTGHFVDKLDEDNNTLETYLVYKDINSGNIKSTCENFKSYKYPHNYSHIKLVREFVRLGEPEFCVFYFDEDKKLQHVKV